METEWVSSTEPESFHVSCWLQILTISASLCDCSNLAKKLIQLMAFSCINQGLFSKNQPGEASICIIIDIFHGFDAGVGFRRRNGVTVFAPAVHLIVLNFVQTYDVLLSSANRVSWNTGIQNLKFKSVRLKKYVDLNISVNLLFKLTKILPPRTSDYSKMCTCSCIK
jgi:hypothetical protein